KFFKRRSLTVAPEPIHRPATRGRKIKFVISAVCATQKSLEARVAPQFVGSLRSHGSWNTNALAVAVHDVRELQRERCACYPDFDCTRSDALHLRMRN